MSTAAKLSELNIGDVVSWTHYGGSVPPIVEGTIIGFSGGLGLRAPEAAVINHANTYPAIPVGDVVVPDNYQEYEYIIVRIPTGVDTYEIREIGKPWIVAANITRQYRQVLTLEIQDFDESQLTTVLRVLRNNGFVKVNYKIS